MKISAEERQRFALFCRSEAESYDALAQQALKLSGGEVIAKQIKRKAALYLVMSVELQNVETVTLNAP